MPRINTEYREDARKKIIDAAVEIAVEEGWGAVTLDTVARKVGVTKGALYSYFENSGILMQDVIIAIVRRIRDQVLASLSGKEDIHAVLENLGDFIFLQPRPFILVFIQAITSVHKNPEFIQRLSCLFDENSVIFVKELARFQQNGQIPAEVNLEEAARSIYCMTLGLGLTTHVLGKDGASARRTWLSSIERILLLDPACRTRPGCG